MLKGKIKKSLAFLLCSVITMQPGISAIAADMPSGAVIQSGKVKIAKINPNHIQIGNEAILGAFKAFYYCVDLDVRQRTSNQTNPFKVKSKNFPKTTPTLFFLQKLTLYKQTSFNMSNYPKKRV